LFVSFLATLLKVSVETIIYMTSVCKQNLNPKRLEELAP
jgi:hypothetical protein